ncbi:MAG: hypothetical protein EPN84_08700 [Legionella sp.]|nr:MAG: hypothetical protein EPN84_08700 [Legionella sp.]
MLLLGLTACGFHLRGMVDIPVWLNNVAIIDKEGNNRDLVLLLKTQLKGYKVKVQTDPARAQYWLLINRSSFQQQIVSIGASTNPRQYQLILTVEFMLQERKGKIVKEPKIVSATRQLTINNDLILGSNEEAALLLKEMRQDAVVQIINRLTRK